MKTCGPQWKQQLLEKHSGGAIHAEVGIKRRTWTVWSGGEASDWNKLHLNPHP